MPIEDLEKRLFGSTGLAAKLVNLPGLDNNDVNLLRVALVEYYLSRVKEEDVDGN